MATLSCLILCVLLSSLLGVYGQLEPTGKICNNLMTLAG